MNPKTPRPAAPGRAHRAANSKELARTFDCQNSEAASEQQASAAPERQSLRTPYATVSGPGAEWVARAISKHLQLALALGGPRAFDCSKTAAALHEAGHCVIGAVQGERPSKTSIWPIRELGRQQWIGRTLYGAPQAHVDNTTGAEADLCVARLQLAGWVSELLFDPDVRAASSVDEVAIGRCIIAGAAAKLRCDAVLLGWKTLASIATILRANEPVVRGIATELMNRGNVKGSRLAYFLQSIGGAHGEI